MYKSKIIKHDLNLLKNEQIWEWASKGVIYALILQAAGTLLSKLIFSEQSSIQYDYYLFPLYAILFAPILEETIFRKLIFRYIDRKWGFVTGAVVSSTLFALGHFSAAGFIGYFLIGMLWCWIYKKTGHIATTILAHMYFNFIVVVVLSLK